ncbi:MAG: ribose-5-phosphate isomerase RpiA [Chloroflexi bacterium]|nr:MAG: ribose-5-phosphate isomerase RpiA [Chloroflexota bacterium]TME47081.1 MAG: ribose-5-phosphate isomerase RpiA [Chloroflexota bacterium]
MEAGAAQVEEQKRAAAVRALDFVRPGMVIGLGTGSTARYFIDALATRVRAGLRIRAVVTSRESHHQAEAGGIELVDDLDQPLDLAVDGADEIDPRLNCIKGRGGALLREKIVAHASQRFLLIADESKLVDRLGRSPVPIEVLPFLWRMTGRSIESLGGRPTLRMAGLEPFRTDNQNLVLDSAFPRVDEQLAAMLETIPGVLEHGIFLGMARTAVIGGAGGAIRMMGALA